ncbi:hypothetical protein NQD34_018517 [Periophthalmus magnuspinnatus]|nr:hypothetical protein NQD34_018517 [Periophthalmus magnuspinnatus]
MRFQQTSLDTSKFRLYSSNLTPAFLSVQDTLVGHEGTGLPNKNFDLSNYLYHTLQISTSPPLCTIVNYACNCKQSPDFLISLTTINLKYSQISNLYKYIYNTVCSWQKGFTLCLSYRAETDPKCPSWPV